MGYTHSIMEGGHGLHSTALHLHLSHLSIFLQWAPDRCRAGAICASWYLRRLVDTLGTLVLPNPTSKTDPAAPLPHLPIYLHLPDQIEAKEARETHACRERESLGLAGNNTKTQNPDCSLRNWAPRCGHSTTPATHSLPICLLLPFCCYLCLMGAIAWDDILVC